MSENENSIQKKEVLTSIPLRLLVITSNNIRKEYKDEDIIELSESMKKLGQLQPIRIYKYKDKYEILFGHRRYIAAQKAELTALNCIIVPEPDSIEKIYIQIAENEQKKELSPEDREAYIKMLRDKGVSFEDIAKNINKSVSWVRECEVAFNVRKKFSNILNNYNLSLGTNDNFALKNATDEQVEEALNMILENPAEKTHTLQDLNIRTKKKNSGKTKKKQINNKIIFEITCDEKKKSVSFKTESAGTLTEPEIKTLVDSLCHIYKNKGYSILTGEK